MIFSEIRPCKTRGALEVVPAEPHDLRLDEVEALLRGANFAVVNAAILVVASGGGIAETTLYEDGHMLVKTLDPREAHRSAAQVLKAGAGIVEDAPFEAYEAAGRIKSKRAR